jgi:hypothetical protein
MGTKMKLFKVVFETEVVILAEDENEAITNASYYVKEEAPELMDLELVESMGQIPNWMGCLPYSAHKSYNGFEKRCEDFVS